MKYFITSFILFLCIQSFAQQTNSCGHFEMEQKYLENYPEVKRQREELELFTKNYTDNYLARINQQSIQLDTILFIIPVVFHIMHNYGPENISKAQILDAVRIINEDFQKLSADTSQVIPLFQPIIGDCQVEFRLAQLDPNGNCTDGITRNQTPLTNGGDDALKAIVQWNPDRYLNIWVENNCGGSFIAYSYYPGVSANLDGVVIMDEYVGSIGTALNNPDVFRVLSHEIGHYLNLKHTWGDSNSPGLASNCNVDDLVSDTPNTIGSSFTCNLNQSTCTPGVIDNVQNIMDYSSCDYMFTQGQCVRMQAALNSSLSDRNNLWTQTNLLLTGTNDSFPTTVCAPVADFSDQKIRICAGEIVTFYDASYGGEYTSINWQFTGGTISASSDTNPSVQYNVAGIYDVTLTVSNGSGSSTLTRTTLVEVSDAIATTTAPVIQDFETLVFPGNGWNYENNIGTHWESTNLAAVSGTTSLYLQNDTTNVGTEDIFYSENFNLSNITAPSFNFKIAFTTIGTSNDNLKIFMSLDCGQTWVLKYAKSGNSLATVNNITPNFIPLSNEWRQDAMNISNASGQPNVRFKFQFISDGGNNIFIDDINISGVTGLEPLNADQINLTLDPNPTLGTTVLKFELLFPSYVSYTLTDLGGRVVLNSNCGKLENGTHTFIIESKNSKGMYFLNLMIGDQKFVKKVLIQ